MRRADATAFTREEIGVALTLASTLDPKNFGSRQAQAVIIKCQAHQDDDRIVGWRLAR